MNPDLPLTPLSPAAVEALRRSLEKARPHQPRGGLRIAPARQALKEIDALRAEVAALKQELAALRERGG